MWTLVIFLATLTGSASVSVPYGRLPARPCVVRAFEIEERAAVDLVPGLRAVCLPAEDGR